MRYILPIALMLAVPAKAQTVASPAQEPVESQLDALVVNVDQASLNAHQALLNVVALAKQQAATARQLTATNADLTKQVDAQKTQIADLQLRLGTMPLPPGEPGKVLHWNGANWEWVEGPKAPSGEPPK